MGAFPFLKFGEYDPRILFDSFIVFSEVEGRKLGFAGTRATPTLRLRHCRAFADRFEIFPVTDWSRGFSTFFSNYSSESGMNMTCNSNQCPVLRARPRHLRFTHDYCVFSSSHSHKQLVRHPFKRKVYS